MLRSGMVAIFSDMSKYGRYLLVVALLHNPYSNFLLIGLYMYNLIGVVRSMFLLTSFMEFGI